MNLFSSWRTALRIARREARRARGRSALVVAMIALPVLGLSMAAVVYDQFTLTGAERADRYMGTADARIQWPWRTETDQDPAGANYWPRPKNGGITITFPQPAEGPGPTATDLLALLPAGTRALPVRVGNADLRTATGIGGVKAVAIDAADRLAHGIVTLRSGRLPASENEVALSAPAVTRLGQGIGGVVTTADGARSYTVVGLVEFSADLGQIVLFALPTSPLPAGVSFGEEWLVDTPTPVTWPQVRQLNNSGVVVSSREVYLRPPPADQVPSFGDDDELVPRELAISILVVGLALLEVILLAGPAFAVSARRRQRQLALVAANGGTPAQIRRIVLGDGVVLGVAGAVVGLAAGIATAFAIRPWVEQSLAYSRAGAHRVFPAALAAIAGIAVLTGVLAALVPALVAGRLNVTAALAGRRGIARSRKRWVFVGLGLVGVGLAVVTYGARGISADLMLAGMAIGELGLVACTPAIVGLVARVGRVLPLAPRIALRDAARNRAAAAPAISAVMAAVAGSVAIGLYFDSSRAQQISAYSPNLPAGTAAVFLNLYSGLDSPPPPSAASLEALLRANLPVDQIRTINNVSCMDTEANERRGCALVPVLPAERECPYLQVLSTGNRGLTTEEQRAARADRRCADVRGYGGLTLQDTVVDNGTALGVYTGGTPEQIAQATAVLRAGGVVVFDENMAKDGQASFVRLDVDSKQDFLDAMNNGPRVSLPAYVMTSAAQTAGTVVSPAALASLGLRATPSMIVASTTRMPTEAERDRLQRQLADANSAGTVELGPEVTTDARLWVLMGVAALITLGATAIATGLAAADGRGDLSTFAAVGASPRLRRGLSLSQAGVIAGLGSLLGAAAGLGAATAVIVAFNQQYVDVWPAPAPMPIVLPWASLAAALVVVPVLAMLGAGLLTRARLPIERRL